MQRECKDNAEDSNAHTGKPSRVWLLLDDRPGHTTQVMGLARLLNWPSSTLKLEFNFMNRVPNRILGDNLISLRRQDRAKLKSPFPDMVIGMGRRIVPVARWIKRQSGGHTRIVLLGRKALGASAAIDLLVSCVHFRQLPREGLFDLVVPPTQVDAESLAAARLARPDPMAEMQRPRVVLLVGGPTALHRFDAARARQLMEQIVRATADLVGQLAIVTSRRTPAEAIDAMRAAAPSTHIHTWQPGRRENPYLSYLANADYLAVTGESESMIAEAFATQLPLTIFPLETRPLGLKSRLANFLSRRAESKGIPARVCKKILLSGWVAPVRDLSIMHRAMQDQHFATVFDGTLNTRPPPTSDASEILTSRLEALLSRRRYEEQNYRKDVSFNFEDT